MAIPQDRLRTFSAQIGRHALALVLLGGLALRLVLAYVVFPGQGYTNDIEVFATWAATLADHGPGGFYANVDAGTPYPPGLLWVLWPFGVLVRVLASVSGAPEHEVAISLVKLPAIAVDIVFAIVVYRILRRWDSERAGLIAAALFLFSPVSWYDSALWGQIDVIGALVVVVALYLVIEGWSESAVAAAVAATLMKPQFGVVLFVVAVVLLRRHLIVRGSGPVPHLSGWQGRLNARLGGLFTARQGPLRLVTSGLVGIAVGLAISLPFDLSSLAPERTASIPLVNDLSGLMHLLRTQAERFPRLTLYAFNPWALVGDPSLATSFETRGDSPRLVGGLSAFAVGSLLLAAAIAAVGVRLIRDEDRRVILIATTVLALSFFVLPTRVHERYIYLAAVVAIPLAAVSARWLVWWLALVGLGTLNLHAVLDTRMHSLPFADLTRTAPAIVATAIGMTILLGLAAWRLFVTRATPAAPTDHVH